MLILKRNNYKKLLIGLFIPIIFCTMPTLASFSETENFKESYKNDLRQLFQQNKATIYALVIRSFNAKDLSGDGLINPKQGESIGTFINAIDRLDELQNMGINTIHLLPVYPLGKIDGLGNAGSVYSPASLTEIDPKLDDKTNTLSVKEEARKFISECHARNIRVMFDIPCCGSVDLANKYPKLFLKGKNKKFVTPFDWTDVRMYKNYADKGTNQLNPVLTDLAKSFIDMCIDLKVDGVRADVAKFRPDAFWKELISYARSKDPNFAFLAESFNKEEQPKESYLLPDRPFELLNDGFDSYYGRYNAFSRINSAEEFKLIVNNNLELLSKLPDNKSIIGSFSTYDEISPFKLYGFNYFKLTTALQMFLPKTNPYFVSGMESGDLYDYWYKDQPALFSDTDSKKYFVHQGRLDIFNYARKPGGKINKATGFITRMASLRNNYLNIIKDGTFEFLPVIAKGESNIIAFSRTLEDRTIIFIANIDKKEDQKAKIFINKIPSPEKFKILSYELDKSSVLIIREDNLSVELQPFSFVIAEIEQ